MPRIPQPHVVARVLEYVQHMQPVEIGNLESDLPEYSTSAIQPALSALRASGKITIADGMYWYADSVPTSDTTAQRTTFDTIEAAPTHDMPGGMRHCDQCQRPFVAKASNQLYCQESCRYKAGHERRKQRQQAEPPKAMGRPPKLRYPITLHVLDALKFRLDNGRWCESLATVAKRFRVKVPAVQRFLDQINPYSDPPAPWKTFDYPAAAYRLAIEHHRGERPHKKPPGLMRRVPPKAE